jgi:hypothetical protein
MMMKFLFQQTPTKLLLLTLSVIIILMTYHITNWSLLIWGKKIKEKNLEYAIC